MNEEAKKLIAELYAKGIRKIDCPYSGSGDEGYVDSMEIIDGDSLNVLLSADEREKIENVAYNLLEDKYSGWEINEGSDGVVHLTLNSNGTVGYKIDHHTRYMSYNESSSSGEED